MADGAGEKAERELKRLALIETKRVLAERDRVHAARMEEARQRFEQQEVAARAARERAAERRRRATEAEGKEESGGLHAAPESGTADEPAEVVVAFRGATKEAVALPASASVSQLFARAAALCACEPLQLRLVLKGR